MIRNLLYLILSYLLEENVLNFLVFDLKDLNFIEFYEMCLDVWLVDDIIVLEENKEIILLDFFNINKL